MSLKEKEEAREEAREEGKVAAKEEEGSAAVREDQTEMVMVEEGWEEAAVAARAKGWVVASVRRSKAQRAMAAVAECHPT